MPLFQFGDGLYGKQLAVSAVLEPVAPRRLREPALKRPDEAGSMFVANFVRDFLDAEVAVRQQVRGSLEPLFGQDVADANPGLLLEQMLEARGAQVDLVRQIIDCMSRFRLDNSQNFAHMLFFHC